MKFKQILTKNIAVFNAFSSMILQFVTVITGFIIPKLILNVFGSEVNGLISSFNQLLGYISLVEGGLTSVVMAKLYKPLINKDKKTINSIVNTTKRFYNKLSIIFIVSNISIALIYPIFVKSSFSYGYVASLGIILGIGLFIQYNFSLAIRTLLNADRKVYIVSWTQVLILIVNTILFYIVIKVYPNIHILKFITGVLYIIQPIIYNKSVKKYYNLNNDKTENKELLKNRWDGFAISIAAFIHNNTDVLILTIFSSLTSVSIYSVYSLVTKGMKQIVTAISSGIVPTIGNAYARR